MSNDVAKLERLFRRTRKKQCFKEVDQAFFWNSLLDVGTNVSIRSSDMSEVKCVWSGQLFFARLTMEDMLLETSTGGLDDILRTVGNELLHLPEDLRFTTLISFLLQHQARCISDHFNCYVNFPIMFSFEESVASVARKVKAAYNFTRGKGVIELPFSELALEVAWRLQKDEIPIVIGNAYSVRQHLLVHSLGAAEVSVLDLRQLDRIFQQNASKEGYNVGQKIAIAVQNGKIDSAKVTGLSSYFMVTGIRSHAQICELGGVDVIDLSPLEALSAKEKLAPGFDSCLNHSTLISTFLQTGYKKIELNRLWELTNEEGEFLMSFLDQGRTSFAEIRRNASIDLSRWFPSSVNNVEDLFYANTPILRFGKLRPLISETKIGIDALITASDLYHREMLIEKFKKVLANRLNMLRRT